MLCSPQDNLDFAKIWGDLVSVGIEQVQSYKSESNPKCLSLGTNLFLVSENEFQTMVCKITDGKTQWAFKFILRIAT